MNKRQLIKNHLSQLNLIELLRYRLLFCAGELNEDVELDIIDLFKYPARLETSYSDNWQKDVLKTLFRKLEGEFESSSQINESILALLSKLTFSEKDQRTISLFENFLASSQSKKVVLIHSSLHRKIDNLTF
jgi:hypothetical protein